MRMHMSPWGVTQSSGTLVWVRFWGQDAYTIVHVGNRTHKIYMFLRMRMLGTDVCIKGAQQGTENGTQRRTDNGPQELTCCFETNNFTGPVYGY